MASFSQIMKDKAAVAKANMMSGDQSDLEIAVAKATNHNPGPPKEKHVLRLIGFSHQSQHLWDLLKALTKRLDKQDWLVTLKALIVLHRILREGDGHLVHNVRSMSGKIFRFANYMDMTNTDAYDFSMFIRHYSAYLEERVCTSADHPATQSGRVLSSEACKSMSTMELFDLLPALQNELDALLNCPVDRQVTNETVLSAFSLLLKDLIPLYRAVNDGLINFLEKFFHMPMTDAVNFVGIFKRFDDETSRVIKYFDIARHINHSSIPLPTSNIQRSAISNLIEKLESHLRHLRAEDSEKRRGSDADAAAMRGMVPPSPSGQDGTRADSRRSISATTPVTPASALSGNAASLLGMSPPPEASIIGFGNAAARAPLASEPVAVPPPSAPNAAASSAVTAASAFDLLTGSPGAASPLQAAAGSAGARGGAPAPHAGAPGHAAPVAVDLFGDDFASLSFNDNDANMKASMVKSVSASALPTGPSYGYNGYQASYNNNNNNHNNTTGGGLMMMQPQQTGYPHPGMYAQQGAGNPFGAAPNPYGGIPMMMQTGYAGAAPGYPGAGMPGAGTNPFLSPASSTSSLSGYAGASNMPGASGTMRSWPSTASVRSMGSGGASGKQAKEFTDLVGMMKSSMPASSKPAAAVAAPAADTRPMNQQRPMNSLI